MRRLARGRVHERITAIPNAFYPAYVVRGDAKVLMIDAGVNHMGPRYLGSLGEILGDPRKLDYLFLTHSHYDHIGGALYLKRHIPTLQIGAHAMVAGLLQKPSVLATMNQLSANHQELLEFNPDHEDVKLRPFAIEFTLREGDQYDLGGLTCRVYETPGHTRDSLSLYVPEIEALFPGDSCGLLEGVAGDCPMVQFVSSYQDYLDSVARMAALRPQIICLAHGWVLTDDDAARFFEDSLEATRRYRELIETHLDAAGGDVDRAVQELAHEEYDIKGGIHQKRESYVANLIAQVRHIAGLR